MHCFSQYRITFLTAPRLKKSQWNLEEAAQLADRVLVLSSRPATICRELRIDAPKPRDLTDEVVVQAMKTILMELGLQTTQSTNT